MEVLIIEQDKEPYTEKIWNDLETLRKKIGNDNIEVIEYDKDTLFIFDADALSNNLPINRYIDGLAIRGTLVIAGNNQKELDFMISMNLKNYTLDRLSVVDRSLLELGAYELLFTTTPTNIVINEIVEISKEYSELDDYKSSKFNNAVLDAIAKSRK